MLVREHVFLNKVYNTVKWIVNTPKDWSSNTHNKNQKKVRTFIEKADEGKIRQWLVQTDKQQNRWENKYLTEWNLFNCVAVCNLLLKRQEIVPVFERNHSLFWEINYLQH